MIDRRYPLEKIAEAFEYVATGDRLAMSSSPSTVDQARRPRRPLGTDQINARLLLAERPPDRVKMARVRRGCQPLLACIRPASAGASRRAHVPTGKRYRTVAASEGGRGRPARGRRRSRGPTDVGSMRYRSIHPAPRARVRNGRAPSRARGSRRAGTLRKPFRIRRLEIERQARIVGGPPAVDMVVCRNETDVLSGSSGPDVRQVEHPQRCARRQGDRYPKPTNHYGLTKGGSLPCDANSERTPSSALPCCSTAFARRVFASSKAAVVRRCSAIRNTTTAPARSHGRIAFLIRSRYSLIPSGAHVRCARRVSTCAGSFRPCPNSHITSPRYRSEIGYALFVAKTSRNARRELVLRKSRLLALFARWANSSKATS